MDSGNSGSIQSSSGGDEEYDSRAESISAFLNPTGHMAVMPNPSPQPPNHTSTGTPMFYQRSNYIDPPLSSPNSLLNMVWSKTLRSDPNCTEINPILASSSSLAQPFFGQYHALVTSSSPTLPFPPLAENPTPRASSAAATSDQNQTHVVRNPKKRSRASRRAPTTVLTTDATNFRAMVQEFTGIPPPPFTSSPFPRSRFDLFATPSTMRSNPFVDLSQQPPYLRRPFAQKAQPPPFISSSSPSSLSSSFLNSSASASINASNSSTSVNYQSLPAELGLLKQPHSTLLNTQYPNLIFQSLLQSPPKYPLAKSTNIDSKTQGTMEIPSNDPHLKMGVLDEFGLSHGHVKTALTGGTALRNDDNLASWGDRRGSSNDGDEGHLRSVNGNYNLLRNITNGKLNFSAHSSNFHGDKGLENVREDMVESWICSSD